MASTSTIVTVCKGDFVEYQWKALDKTVLVIGQIIGVGLNYAKLQQFDGYLNTVPVSSTRIVRLTEQEYAWRVLQRQGQ